MSLRLVRQTRPTSLRSGLPRSPNNSKPLPPSISLDSMSLPDLLQLLTMERPAALRVIRLYAEHAAKPILRKLANDRIAQIAAVLSGALLASC